jgi:hypothetical protein
MFDVSVRANIGGELMTVWKQELPASSSSARLGAAIPGSATQVLVIVTAVNNAGAFAGS